jgi:hypothetical protein
MEVTLEHSDKFEALARVKVTGSYRGKPVTVYQRSPFYLGLLTSRDLSPYRLREYFTVHYAEGGEASALCQDTATTLVAELLTTFITK